MKSKRLAMYKER